MDKKTYYGTDNPKTFTYLEFGEIDTESCKKKIWGFNMHQKAYDWFMLSRYANDIVAFNKLTKMIVQNSNNEIINFYNDEIHHDDEASLNLSKIIALSVAMKNPILDGPSFYELGQTIFGCIDGMEFSQAYLKSLGINFSYISLNSVEWFGVDISELFNDLSCTFHKQYNVKTMLEQDKLPIKMDVFFSKGITLLYAIRDIKELFQTIQKGRIACFDYSFSLDKVEDTTIGSGKTVRYLKFNDFLDEYKNHTEVLFVKKSNSRILADSNRIWIDCIYGEEDLCNKYIELDTKIRKELYSKLSGIEKSERLLNNDHSPEWMTLQNFIESI